MENPNTRDFFDLDYDQLKEAGVLLQIYRSAHDKTELLGFPISVEWNPNTQTLFLLDREFHTAVLQGIYLVDYLICGCLAEGFREEMFARGGCCREIANLNR